MQKLVRRGEKQPGLSPGTLVHIGEGKNTPTKISIIRYNETQLLEKQIDSAEDGLLSKDASAITWINVAGLQETEVIEKVGKHFDIHPLVLEDIVNTEQRPKMEDLGDYIFVVLKALSYWDKSREIKIEQTGIIIGANYVISFQEGESEVFTPVRERIRKGKGRIRKSGADYLAYALIDVIIDNYYVVLEKLGDKIETLEEELVDNPRRETLNTLHNLKKDMILMRKSVWPLRELVSCLERSDSDIIKEATNIFIRDIYDHTVQIIDTLETFRDMVSEMFDIYLSSISNRLNEIMKVLTIITTIFVPLTFIVGVYGMNFKNMPELQWDWGYVAVWGVLILVATIMIIYVKRRKWL